MFSMQTLSVTSSSIDLLFSFHVYDHYEFMMMLMVFSPPGFYFHNVYYVGHTPETVKYKLDYI